MNVALSTAELDGAWGAVGRSKGEEGRSEAENSRETHPEGETRGESRWMVSICWGSDSTSDIKETTLAFFGASKASVVCSAEGVVWAYGGNWPAATIVYVVAKNRLPSRAHAVWRFDGLTFDFREA